MKLTSTFVLAALFALKATSVLAMPIISGNSLASLEARDFGASTDAQLEARSFDDEFEFDARDFGEEFDLDARDFSDYEEFQARGRFDRKIGAEEGVMSPEKQRIKAKEQRIQNQKKDVSLQKQIHGDRQALRKDTGRLPGTGSRFQTKIGSEQAIMGGEERKIKDQEARLQSQKKDMSLQQQMHADRMTLRKDAAANPFARRELGHGGSSHVHSSPKLPASFRHTGLNTHGKPASERRLPSSRFQNKIASEDHTMHLEQERIAQEERRLKMQQQSVGLQEQIHKDYSALRADKAF